jgi:hypothetical protein
MTPSLLQAIDDERLLGAGFRPYRLQRDALAGIEGHRRSVLACGRRSGKSLISAAAACWDACLRDDLDRHVRPGEPRYSICIAINLRQSRLWLDQVHSLLEASPLMRGMVTDRTDDEIVLENGNRICAFPCTSRGSRGWAVSYLALDEYAWHTDTNGDAAGPSVWAATVPSTYQFAGDARIVAASTPAGPNYFHALFEQAEQDPDSFAMQASSPEMNERLDGNVLHAEMEADPDMYASEIEAKFTAGGGQYIDRGRLRECVVDRGPLGRLDATGWVIGCDLAFVSDPCVAVVAGRDPADPERLLVGNVRRWEPAHAGDFETRRHVEDAMLGEIADLAHTYEASVVVDQFCSSAVADFFTRAGVAATVLPMTVTSKSAMFAELRSRIYNRTIEFPADDDLLADLCALRTVIRPGAASVATPRTRRGHADGAVACALSIATLPVGPPLSASSGSEPRSVADGGLDDLLADWGGGITTDFSF